MTKNGDARDVPLLDSAKELLKLIPDNGSDKLLNISSSTFQNMFGNRLRKIGLTDFHFHDTRHEGITRMVRKRKIPVEVLAKITGQRLRR